MSIQGQKGTATRRTFWAVAIFYLLIAFEFFYMASPFAIYFYSIYGPGLNFINSNPLLAWLSSVFLPHIVVETSSALLNLHNIIGVLLALGGFLAFCVGAGQVYYHKLVRKGAVMGGVYNFIRHPQYAALVVSSFGMLLHGPGLLCCSPLSPCSLSIIFWPGWRRTSVRRSSANPTLTTSARPICFYPSACR